MWPMDHSFPTSDLLWTLHFSIKKPKAQGEGVTALRTHSEAHERPRWRTGLQAPESGSIFCPEPIQTRDHTEHEGPSASHLTDEGSNSIMSRRCVRIRHVRLYLYLPPVHWRFSSGQWNGLPARHRSRCLHPTPGFSPSDTREGTFPWRSPVHATRGRHNSSAPWFAPKNKAKRMGAMGTKCDLPRKTHQTCWKYEVSSEKLWTFLHPTPVKISYTQRTLLMSYSAPDTVPGTGAKVSKARGLPSRSSHPHTGKGVKLTLCYEQQCSPHLRECSRFKPRVHVYKRRNLCKSLPQSGPHHKMELMSYWLPRQSTSKILRCSPCRVEGSGRHS